MPNVVKEVKHEQERLLFQHQVKDYVLILKLKLVIVIYLIVLILLKMLIVTLVNGVNGVNVIPNVMEGNKQGLVKL